ncbi:hypothetical protein SAMN05421770_101384 [Granulicella rosea]|uniref:Uncharacterized protein n=1 Tax=Granulicella rosea TaxID=474952 RepID=A0A239DBB0_9BACT|nr:hypothetical protein [Granulicella rosea]SNS29645.1 hypothetical protein SAMN05421770_101384 [Granulicella rosea]
MKGFAILAVVMIVFIRLIARYGSMSDVSVGPLKRSIRRAKKRIRPLLNSRFPNINVSSFGAIEIDPQYLCLCIDTTTDAEKDTLQHDTDLLEQMRQEFVDAGYPADSVPLIAFSIESQETVDRDFGGSWWTARK